MQPSKNKKMPTLLNNMTKFIDTLGLSHDENQCVDKCWSNLFHHYFKYIGVDHLCKLQVTPYYHEVLEPNKTGTARERKEAPSQTLLSKVSLRTRRKSSSVLTLLSLSFIN
jgi:hypothetical protein